MGIVRRYKCRRKWKTTPTVPPIHRNEEPQSTDDSSQQHTQALSFYRKLAVTLVVLNLVLHLLELYIFHKLKFLAAPPIHTSPDALLFAQHLNSSIPFNYHSYVHMWADPLDVIDLVTRSILTLVLLILCIGLCS